MGRFSSGSLLLRFPASSSSAKNSWINTQECLKHFAAMAEEELPQHGTCCLSGIVQKMKFDEILFAEAWFQILVRGCLSRTDFTWHLNILKAEDLLDVILANRVCNSMERVQSCDA